MNVILVSVIKKKTIFISQFLKNMFLVVSTKNLIPTLKILD